MEMDVCSWRDSRASGGFLLQSRSGARALASKKAGTWPCLDRAGGLPHAIFAEVPPPHHSQLTLPARVHFRLVGWLCLCADRYYAACRESGPHNHRGSAVIILRDGAAGHRHHSRSPHDAVALRAFRPQDRSWLFLFDDVRLHCLCFWPCLLLPNQRACLVHGLPVLPRHRRGKFFFLFAFFSPAIRPPMPPPRLFFFHQ